MQRKCKGVLIDTWIRKSILDKKVYNLTGSSRSNVPFQAFQGRKNMETSLSHYLLMPCLICLLSASPLAHTTAHPPLSLLSDEKLQRLIPVPFFPFNKHQGRFIKESTVGGDRSTQFGLPLRISPPALGTEQPGWGSCYTLVQEMPSAKCPPEWCFSKWAKKNILYMAAEVHHSCHKNIRT